MEAVKQTNLPENPSSLTSHEFGSDHSQDEYVLTEEDERLAIENAKHQHVKLLIWRLAGANYLPQQIEAKIRSINWDDEIDIREVLRIANKNKAHQIWIKKRQSDRNVAEREKAEKLAKECDYAYFYNLMKKNCLQCRDEFIENENTLYLIKTICFFMSKDRRFEDEMGFDLKKGLMLRGTCGLGKTFLFNLVKDNLLMPVSIISLLEIADIVKDEGSYMPTAGGILYLDDLGSEQSEVVHYGTRINWFKNFFEKFYLRSRHFERLIVSTNLSFDELEEKYGYRFRSRVKEVFNIVDVKGEDLRR